MGLGRSLMDWTGINVGQIIEKKPNISCNLKPKWENLFVTNLLFVDKNQFCKLLHMVIFVFIKKKTVLDLLNANHYQVIFILSQNAQRFACWLKNVAFWTVMYYTCMYAPCFLTMPALMFKKKEKKIFEFLCILSRLCSTWSYGNI